MPAITVEAAKLTREQKTQLIAELTESASKILGLPKEIIFVFLKENDPDNIGAGGLPLCAPKTSCGVIQALHNTWQAGGAKTSGLKFRPSAALNSPYRESCSFLRRSADELHTTLQNHKAFGKAPLKETQRIK